MRKVIGALAAPLAVGVLLAGCSPVPARDEVIETVEIELAGAFGGEREDWTDLASGLADDALNGRCESDAYYSGLTDETLQYVWNVACRRYFEGQMTASQIDRATQSIAEHVVGTLEE